MKITHVEGGRTWEDWGEVEVPSRGAPQVKGTLAPWREAERYFKRYRDTQKAIPLRMKLKDEVGG